MAKSTSKTSKTAKKKKTKRINPHIAKPYKSEYAELAQKMVASGAQEMDIAYLLGTSTFNLRKWKRENEDFAKAINRGKQFTLAYLIGKGIQKAGGYDYIEEKESFVKDKDGNLLTDVKVTRTPKHVPPDGSLLMFLVQCLDRKLGGDMWRSVQHIDKKEEKTIRVINGKAIADQIEKLGGKWANAIEAEFEVNEPKQLAETHTEK